MPELPEVEAVRRALKPLLVGQRIRGIRVIRGIAVRPQKPTALRAAVGLQITEVARRGKYLLLRGGPGGRGVLVLHFKLDGHLVWYDGRAVEDFIDVAIELDKGTLGFADPRRFGRVNWFTDRALPRGIRNLGPDALNGTIAPSNLGEILGKSRRAVKLVLLDQTNLAGLGNIYASEALWRARVSPWRAAERVGPKGARRLHKAIGGVLERALECCTNPPPNFRDAGWWFQGLDEILAVYGREGKLCRRRGCGGQVRRKEQGGRSTYYCPRCQR